jgi:hypothetical protein
MPQAREASPDFVEQPAASFRNLEIGLAGRHKIGAVRLTGQCSPVIELMLAAAYPL